MAHFHTIKGNKKDNTGEQSVDIFTFKGQEDFLNDEECPMLEAPGEDVDLFTLVDAYAILVNNGTSIKYYVKRGKYGKLFNPIGMYSEGTQRKQHRHAGKPAWEFKQCSKKVFTHYTHFLRTRNAAWLNNAEREV